MGQVTGTRRYERVEQGAPRIVAGQPLQQQSRLPRGIEGGRDGYQCTQAAGASVARRFVENARRVFAPAVGRQCKAGEWGRRSVAQAVGDPASGRGREGSQGKQQGVPSVPLEVAPTDGRRDRRVAYRPQERPDPRCRGHESPC
jgi:hypothetical protein